MPRLFQELTERIIDHLHDSFWDLHACSLVCKAWVVPSRVHLFYTVKIENWFDFKYSAFQGYPYLAFHVREIVFRPLCIGLPKTLPLFTRLCKLTVVGADWTSLGPERRNFLRRILARPTLTQLELRIMAFDRPEHIKNLLRPHLKYLTLIITALREGTTQGYHVVDEEIKQDVVSEQQPCRLEYLHCEHLQVAHFVDQILGTQSGIDITNVRIFKAYFSGLYESLRLVRLLKPSLEHLTLEQYEHYDSTYDLGWIPNLKTILLISSLEEGSPPSVLSLLSSFKAPNLQEISFRFGTIYPIRSKWVEVDRFLDGLSIGREK